MRQSPAEGQLEIGQLPISVSCTCVYQVTLRLSCPKRQEAEIQQPPCGDLACVDFHHVKWPVGRVHTLTDAYGISKAALSFGCAVEQSAGRPVFSKLLLAAGPCLVSIDLLVDLRQ